MSSDRCEWPRCREVMHLIYFEKPLCEDHWEMISKMSPKKLRIARAKLGIRVEVKEVKGEESDGEELGRPDSGRRDEDTLGNDDKQGYLFSPIRNV